jgi:hypothetical protein
MATMTEERPSTLTRKQSKTFGPKSFKWNGEPACIKATVRFDDECGNGRNTFAITGVITQSGREQAWGRLHDEIATAIPELAPFIKWHLVSTNEPMHYGANSIYHALEHGPKYAWVYFTGESDPLRIGEPEERIIGYLKADEAKRAEGEQGYRVVWDEKSAKVRNLDHARSSAVWPDATDEELTAPGLKERLQARLPALMAEFRQAVESLGFTW